MNLRQLFHDKCGFTSWSLMNKYDRLVYVCKKSVIDRMEEIAYY